MQYSVRGSDGNDYGPVDLQTLKSWVADSRIFPDTLITDNLANRQFAAKELPELGLAQPAANPYATGPVPPQGQSYPRQVYREEGTKLWAILFWLTIAFIFGSFTRTGGIFISVFGLYDGFRAKSNDDKYGNLCLGISIAGFLIILGWTYLKYTNGGGAAPATAPTSVAAILGLL